MKVRKFAMEFFSRFIFGPGIFWRFDFCPHSIIPVTWNPEPTPDPPGSAPAAELKWYQGKLPSNMIYFSFRHEKVWTRLVPDDGANGWN